MSGEPAVMEPHDLAAEKALLGAMISNPAALTAAAQIVRGGDFYWPSHGLIFDAVLAKDARGESVDVLTVCIELDRKGLLEQVHGRGYLLTLVESFPVAANAAQYATRVQQLAHQRGLLRGLQSATEAAGAHDFDAAASRTVRGCLDTCGELLAGGDAGRSSLTLYTGCQLAEMDCAEPEAVCAGLLYRGCSTDMIADPKRGKTTLALSVGRAIVRGEVWCGRHTRKTGVLYLTEQSPHSFNPQCGRAGLLDESGFHALFHRDVLGLGWAEIGELVVREAEAREVGVVVVDNLSLWAGIAGDEENEAGVALQTLRVIEQMTGAGLAVFAIRHARKGGGSISEAGRGSSAIAGGFDVLVQVKGDKVPQRRIIEATGRVFAKEPPPLVVELAGDGGFQYVREGGRASTAEATEAILGRLSSSMDEAVREDAIIAACQAVGVGKPLAQKTLRELCENGSSERLVARAKSAGAASAHAYGYWRCDDA